MGPQGLARWLDRADRFQDRGHKVGFGITVRIAISQMFLRQVILQKGVCVSKLRIVPQCIAKGSECQSTGVIDLDDLKMMGSCRRVRPQKPKTIVTIRIVRPRQPAVQLQHRNCRSGGS